MTSGGQQRISRCAQELKGSNYGIYVGFHGVLRVFFRLIAVILCPHDFDGGWVWSMCYENNNTSRMNSAASTISKEFLDRYFTKF